MDTEQVNEILRLLKIIADSSTANKIAAISMIVSGIAVLSSIYFSHQTRVQYIESLSPMLSFELSEIKGILFLTVLNAGQSYAEKINLSFKSINNNGERAHFYTGNYICLYRATCGAFPDFEGFQSGNIAKSQISDKGIISPCGTRPILL